MLDLFCKQLQLRGLLTEREHHVHMRRLLDWSSKNIYGVAFSNLYLSAGPELTQRMLAQNADWTVISKITSQVVVLVEEGKLVLAGIQYGEMLEKCFAFYWPEFQSPMLDRSIALLAEAKRRVEAGLTIEGVVPELDQARGIKTLPIL